MDDDLREVILRTDERTKNILERLDRRDVEVYKREQLVDKRLDAHAGKIRTLEQWRYLVVGGFGALAAIVKFNK